MSLLDFMQNPEFQMSEDDYVQKERDVAAGYGGSSDFWNPGNGSNHFFLLPILDPKTGKFTTVIEWYEHKKFLEGRSVVCLNKTFGLKCEICDARYHLFKDVFNHTPERGKHRLLKETALYEDFRAAAAIYLVNDSGDKGTQKFPRDTYEPKKAYTTSLTKDPWDSVIQLSKDPDLNRRFPFWNPTRAKMIDYTIRPASETSTGRRAHKVQARHVDARPIVELEDGSPNVTAIEEILKQAEGFAIWAYRYNMNRDEAVEEMAKFKESIERRQAGEKVPLYRIKPKPFSSEMADKIDERLDDIRELAFAEIGKTYIPKRRRGGAAGQQASQQRGTSYGPAADDPRTRTIGDTGRPLCHSRGLFEVTHPTCVSCDFMISCDKAAKTPESPNVPLEGDYEFSLDVSGVGSPRDDVPPPTDNDAPSNPSHGRNMPPSPDDDDIPF